MACIIEVPYRTSIISIPFQVSQRLWLSMAPVGKSIPTNDSIRNQHVIKIVLQGNFKCGDAGSWYWVLTIFLKAVLTRWALKNSESQCQSNQPKGFKRSVVSSHYIMLRSATLPQAICPFSLLFAWAPLPSPSQQYMYHFQHQDKEVPGSTHWRDRRVRKLGFFNAVEVR